MLEPLGCLTYSRWFPGRLGKRPTRFWIQRRDLVSRRIWRDFVVVEEFAVEKGCERTVQQIPSNAQLAFHETTPEFQSHPSKWPEYEGVELYSMCPFTLLANNQLEP